MSVKYPLPHFCSIRVLAFLLVAAFGISVPAQAQFDRLLNKTTRKLGDELERRAVEKLSEIIARKAAEKIENEFDKMLREAMAEDAKEHNRDSSYYQPGSRYGEFLRSLNSTADLPDSYSFDLNILTEVVQEDEETETMRLYYSRSAPVFAIQTATSEKESQIILIDAGTDVTVLYQHDGDKRTAQALPNMMNLMAGMASESEIVDSNFVITKLNKKQRIAGYKCQGYEGYSGEDRYVSWFTDELDVDWSDNYGRIVQKFAPECFRKTYDEVQGVGLKSELYSGKEEKLTMSMEAKEVNIEETVINNADYDFGYEQ